MPKPPQKMDRGCPTEEQLVLYVEKGLSEEDQVKIVEHLANCNECRSIAASLHKGELNTQQLEEQAKKPLEPRPVWPSESVPSGSKIGRYVIIQMVGEGGMGEVYSAYDPELDRKVALKLVHAEFFEEPGDPAGSRLLREAQAMAKLSHPNVLSVYDVHSIEGDLAIAMEFIDGMTLGKWCKAEKRTWKEVLKMYIHAGEGLNSAHKAGFVHRDFKPENVLVRKDGQVFVTDFGLVRQANEEGKALGDKSMLVVKKEKVISQKALSVQLTKTGALMGTPAYMAPEQLQGKEVDARADQYSFFVSLYEGLFGERPIEAKSLEEYQELTNSKEIVVPKKNDVPQWLKAILLRGLSKDPEKRYCTMAQVLLALRKEKATKWKIILGAVALIASTALGAIAAQHFTTNSKFHCSLGSAEVLSLLNEAKKEKLKLSFLATKVKHAEDSYIRVTSELDRYIRQLSLATKTSCESSSNSAYSRSSLIEVQTICLNSARVAVSSLVEILVRPLDVASMENAMTATLNLPRIYLCTDPASLEVFLKTDLPRSQQSVEAKSIEKLLHEAESLVDLGRPNEALLAAKSALEKSKATPEYFQLGEALYWVGRINEVQGNYEEAHHYLVAASDQAGMVGDLRIYLRAILIDSEVTALRWNQPLASSRRLHEIPEKLVESAHDKVLLADFLHTRGYINSKNGKLDESIVELKRAINLYVESYGTWDNPSLPRAIQALGIVLYDAGQEAEAAAQGEQALRIAERISGPESLWVGIFLCSQSITYVWRNKPEIAREYAQRGLMLETGIVGSEHWYLNACLSTLGQVLLYYDKKAAESIPYFERSLKIVGEHESKDRDGALRALISLGDAYLDSGQPIAAHDSFERALKIISENEKSMSRLVDFQARAKAGLAQSLWIKGEDPKRAQRLITEAFDAKAKLTYYSYLDKQILDRIATWKFEILKSTNARTESSAKHDERKKTMKVKTMVKAGESGDGNGVRVEPVQK